MTVVVNNTIAGGGVSTGSGGSSTWGSITGTLSSQSDLQAGLDLKSSLGAINVFTKNQSVNPVTLTDGATVATDVSLSNNFYLTLTADAHVMGLPTNPTNGMQVQWTINSGVGGFTFTWHASFDFGGAGAPTHSTTASKEDIVSARYSTVTSKWRSVFNKGS